MNSVLFAASSLLSVPACLVYGRSLWLVATQFATLQGTPLLFVLILMLDLSIAALIVLDSRRSKLCEQLPKELHEPQRMLGLQPKWFLALLDNANDGIPLNTPRSTDSLRKPFSSRDLWSQSRNPRRSERPKFHPR